MFEGRETVNEALRETVSETVREALRETVSLTKGLHYDMQPDTVPPFIQPIFESCVFSPMTTPATSPPLYDSSFLVHFEETSRINIERRNSLGSYTYPPGLPIRPEQSTGPPIPPYSHPFSPFQENNKSLTQMIHQLNTYEFIFSKVPNSNLSVSKLKPYSNTFYIYMEIFQMFRFLDLFENVNMKTLHIGKNNHSIIECLNMIREDSEDIHMSCSTIYPHNHEEKGHMNIVINNDYQFLSYELLADEEDNGSCGYNTSRRSIFEMGRKMLIHLLKNQASNGICIIQIRDLFHKPLLDILYMLTTLYEKVYIIKPNHSNIFKSERFIICKNFILNSRRQIVYDKYCKMLAAQVVDGFALTPDSEPFFTEAKGETIMKPYISSFIDNDLPYYFLCKIEESNIIIGHQQLENMDHLLSLYKGKNNEEKIEMIKKSNIQKCIQWCEKYKIPYNKFIEKVNIFIAGKPHM
jgi:hypothetical protein